MSDKLEPMRYLLAVFCVTRKRGCCTSAFLCLCVCQIIAMIFMFRKSYQNEITLNLITCDDRQNKDFLDKLCAEYSLSVGVWGSLCPALCVTGSLKFSKCLGHGKDLVMLGLYKDQKVVMKADVNLGYTISNHFKDMTPDLIARYNTTANEIRRIMTRYYHLEESVVDTVIQECDAKSDGKIGYKEALHCWHMIDEQESLVMLRLSGNPAIPTLYGTCHNLFVVEYAPSDSFTNVPKFKEYRSWQFRAKLALGLIQMTRSLENAENHNKTLHVCDFQEANFGIVKSDQGNYIVKSIDNDISMFETDLTNNVLLDRDKSCTKDEHCYFLNCVATCNQKTKTCTGKHTSNNLRVLCSRFFSERVILSHPITNLLNNPPAHVAGELTSLIHQCSHPLTPSTKIPVALADKLEAVLLRSLDHPRTQSDITSDIS